MTNSIDKQLHRGKSESRFARDLLGGIVLAGLIGGLGFFHIVNTGGSFVIIPKISFSYANTFISVEEVLDKNNNRTLVEAIRGDQQLDNLIRQLQRKGHITKKTEKIELPTDSAGTATDHSGIGMKKEDIAEKSTASTDVRALPEVSSGVPDASRAAAMRPSEAELDAARASRAAAIGRAEAELDAARAAEAGAKLAADRAALRGEGEANAVALHAFTTMRRSEAEKNAAAARAAWGGNRIGNGNSGRTDAPQALGEPGK